MNAVDARSTVDVADVIVAASELTRRPEPLARAAVMAGEQLVERLLPRGRMEVGTRRQDAVEVEDANADLRAEPEQRSGRSRAAQVTVTMRIRHPAARIGALFGGVIGGLAVRWRKIFRGDEHARY